MTVPKDKLFIPGLRPRRTPSHSPETPPTPKAPDAAPAPEPAPASHASEPPASDPPIRPEAPKPGEEPAAPKRDLRRLGKRKQPRRQVAVALPYDLFEDAVLFLQTSARFPSMTALIEEALRQKLAREKRSG